jgi:hypothetical protein
MTKGSCLCGRVAFEVDTSGVVVVVGCYCANCRKVSGSQYGVYYQVRSDAFRWLAGADEVASYESSPGNKRGYCVNCGCVAPIATAYGAIRVPGGAFDEDPARGVDVVLFDGGKADWCALDAATQRFEDAGPPDFWRGVITRLIGATR